MLPFPDTILPGILPTTLHGDHPLEELNFLGLGLVCVCACDGVSETLRPPPFRQKKEKSVSWRNTVGSLMV